jgi:Bacterial aa3 type cytochrome c oxidase subunit IV
MADHGEVQYATATGNDMPAHEAGYSQFLQATFVGTAMVINILFGLTIGGVLGHWLPAAFILVASAVAAGVSGWTGSRAVSLGMVAVSALTLLFNVYS